MSLHFHTPFRKAIWKLQRLFWSGEKLARKSGVNLGKNCRILTKDFGSEPFLITIGDNVTVSGDVKFINHDGAGWLVRDEKGRRYSYRPIEIGNNVFIGSGTIIMPGTKIADNVIVGAGSVVTKSVPNGIVVGGQPAKYICDYSDFETRALDWVSDADMPQTGTYRERVEAVTDHSFKPLLNRP